MTRTLLLAFIACLNTAIAAAERQIPDLQGVTAGGIRVEIYSKRSPLVINQIHSWHVQLMRGNEAVTGVELAITGGMPEHDHGLPTQPQITGELEDGVYLLQGVRFHMPGSWQIFVIIRENGAEDRLTINFQL